LGFFFYEERLLGSDDSSAGTSATVEIAEDDGNLEALEEERAARRHQAGPTMPTVCIPGMDVGELRWALRTPRDAVKDLRGRLRLR